MLMRRFFVILLIALLPLRSWAGDLMALSMSTQVLQAANVQLVASQRASADENCPGHTNAKNSEFLQTSVDAGTSQAADGDEHCKSCVSCQICHSVALVNVISVPHGALEGTLKETLLSSRFASATLADCVKPPIS